MLVLTLSACSNGSTRSKPERAGSPTAKPMLVGTSVKPGPGESWPAAWQRTVGMLAPQTGRIFYSGGCPGPEDSKVTAVVSSGAVPLISFRTWDGTSKANFTRLVASLDRATVTFNHEPEDNPVTTASIAQTYREMRAIVDAAGKQGKIELWHVLMRWTLDPRSGRDVEDYLSQPLLEALDGLGWDVYAGPKAADGPTRTPELMYGPAAAESKKRGLAFGVFETGARVAPSTDDAEHARFYEAAIAYNRTIKAAYLTLWNSRVGTSNYVIDQLPRTVAVWKAAAK